MPRFLIAPDSFKGTLTAIEVCDIISDAVKSVFHNAEIEKLPLADGGEGLVSAYFNVKGGKIIKEETLNPYFEPMTADYLIFNNTAVIEMASCAGLPLVEDRKNPLKTSTVGVGILINSAIKNGAKKIILGLGGSATNDCGIGMASKLGYRFLDANNANVVPVGENLINVIKIKKPENMLKAEIIAACDVDNPLYGEMGAAYVYAPQKGADNIMVKELDEGLRSISKVIECDLGFDVRQMKGAGAAGGMGAAVTAFLCGTLCSGIDLFLDEVQFIKKCEWADIVITGEGKMDAQSMHGKVISGVAKRAKSINKPVIALCGCLGGGTEEMKNIGVTDMYGAVECGTDFEIIKKNCKTDLYITAQKALYNINNKYF